MTILKRLIISYLIIIILIIISGAYTILNLDKLDKIIHAATSVDARMIRLSEQSSELLYAMTASEEKYFISKDPDYYRQFQEISAYFTKNMSELGKLADTPEKKSLSAKIKLLHSQYRSLFKKKAISVKNELGEDIPSVEYQKAKQEMIANIDQSLQNIAKFAAKSKDDKLQMSEIVSARVTKVITATEIGAIILVILISLQNTKRINSPISLLREKTKVIAKGEFGAPLKIDSPPEIKELADAFNVMCERLKELDQIKIDFISHLSHELRTPLTAIKEASSMLLEGVFSDIPDKQKELFGVIKEECERLINSVNRILDLSRMEAGRMDFSFQTSSLLPIIEKKVQKLSPIAQKKKIDVTLDLAPSLPEVRIDPEKIEEAIGNLLSNALKFTPEEGRVIIHAINNIQNKTIEISVSDTGPGIPEEELKEVFDKFKRVDEKKVSVRGTGLGLSIVKHIINAHGGYIWAKSEPGQGSTFTFSLPVSQ